MRKSFPIILLSIAFSTICWCQEFRSTLSGLVLDQQQAVVPHAKIVARQVDTGAVTGTVSGADGRYSLPFLLPGVYQVTVDVQGFKSYRREGVVISTNERRTLDVTLQIGSLTESITVTADAPMLDAATASVGDVVSSRQIESMALNGRTPMVAARAIGGVIPLVERTSIRPFDGGVMTNLSIAGTPARSNELLLDGSPNFSRGGKSAFSPPVDSVAELKVEVFQVDAAYGHSGGGTITVVTKAGTNKFHGTASDYNQTSALAATPFFSNSSGQKKPVTRSNQYSATAGGPVYVPKVFDGRNKLLFYVSYEAIRNPSASPSIQTVPTEAERKGDFSQLLAINPNYQIYDPLTGAVQGSRILRQAFAGNVISASRLNPVAQNFLRYWPQSNLAGTADGTNNYYMPSVANIIYDNEMGRLDFLLGPQHKLFYNFRASESSQISQTQNVALGRYLNRINWGSMVDDVYTLSPTTVLNVRLNWTRWTEVRTRTSNGIDLQSLGFPATLAASSPRTVLPLINLAGSTSDSTRGTNVGDDAGSTNPTDIFHLLPSVTKQYGKHMIKIGADLRVHRESMMSYGYSSGSYTFGTNWTRGPLDNASAAPAGQQLASFMLGLPTAGSFDLNGAYTNQAGYYALFVQDDFRVRPDLTFNLGVRYEKESPSTERFNRVVNGFDFTSPNSITAAAKAAYALNPVAEIPASQFNPVGGLLFASKQNRSLYATRSHYFAPRFGFAWTPRFLQGKAVIRGGFGVFQFPLGVNDFDQPGFSQTTQMVPTLDSYRTPSATLSNPFPAGLQQPVGSALGLNTYLGQSVSFFNPSPLNPYSLRWNLNVQRLLSKDMVFEFGYMGNHAVHLTVDRKLDYVPAAYLSNSPVRDTAAINRLTANVPNPFAGLIPGSTLNGSTVARSQLLMAFPQFSGVTMESTNQGSSYYHSLLMRMEKRFSHGFQLMANYQFSKLIERRTFLNTSDPLPEKRIAAEDRPHVLMVSGVYELPFGKGKRFDASAVPGLNWLIGGWQLNALQNLQSGSVLSWGNVIYNGGGLDLHPHQVDGGAFDKTRFNTNSQQQLANNIRTFPSQFSNLRADRLNNMEVSIIKQIPLREPLRLQYRCEFFNLMNHPVFAAPNLSPTSSAFGTITDVVNAPRTIQMALRLVW